MADDSQHQAAAQGNGASAQPNKLLETYNRLTYETKTEHVDEPLELLSGTLPTELSGVLFRNGPGRMHVFGYPYRHLFDGDGMVQRFAFDGGSVRYSNRFVRTRDFVREEQARRPLFRSFGTNLPGGPLKNAGRFHFKNAANTHLLEMDGELLALWEGGVPHRLHPSTLETLGTWESDGFLAPHYMVEKMMGNARPFAAHYKREPATGDVFAFALLPGVPQRLLRYHVPSERPANGGPRATTSETTLPRLSFMHDYVLTAERDMVFFDVPVSFRLFSTFAGLSSPVGSIVEDRDGPTIIRIFGEDGTSTTAETSACYVFHFPNGSRQEDGRLRLLACRMSYFPGAEEIAGMMKGQLPDRGFYAYLTQFVVDDTSGRVTEERCSDYPMELPSINPAYLGLNNRYVWAVADHPDRVPNTLLHGVAKFDLETGETAFADRYPNVVGEPLFVSFPDSKAEDDGWLLSLQVDVENGRSILELLDARDLSSLATVLLPEPTHIGFHGLFSRST